MSRRLPPVDDDVFEELQRLAEPLVDDVNSVLRRVLGLSPATERAASDKTNELRLPTERPHETVLAPRTGAARAARRQRKPARGRSGTRAQRGTLLPEREYEGPLLQVLAACGGAVPASEAIEGVGLAIADRLTEADKETLASGLTRWKNRVQFVRLKLVQAGHIKRQSPRGIWEITPAGRDYLKKLADAG